MDEACGMHGRFRKFIHSFHSDDLKEQTICKLYKYMAVNKQTRVAVFAMDLFG